MTEETKLPDEIAVCPTCGAQYQSMDQGFAQRILELIGRNDALAVDLDTARQRVAELEAR